MTDPGLSQFAWIETLRQRPWDVSTAYQTGHELIESISGRTLEHLGILFSRWDFMILVLSITLGGFSIAHLMQWRKIWTQDLRPRASSRSGSLMLMILSIGAWISQLWVPWVLFCLSIAALYSYKPRFFLSGLTLLGLLWSASPLVDSWSTHLQNQSAREALRSDRTLKFYDTASMNELSPIEAAYWAWQDEDNAMLREQLSRAPSSDERTILEAYIQIQGLSPAEGALALDALVTRFADHKALVYSALVWNLRAQNLSRADTLRARLSPEEIQSFEKYYPGDLVLVPALRPIDAAEVIKKFELQSLSLWRLTWLALMGLIFFLFHMRASGRCKHTGQLTIRRDIDVSAAYTSAYLKNHASQAVVRQRVDQDIRDDQRHQTQTMRQLSWLALGDRSITDEQSRTGLFLIHALMVTLAVIALPLEAQTRLYRLAGLYSPVELPWSVSLPLLIVAVVLYVVTVRNQRKKLL